MFGTKDYEKHWHRFVAVWPRRLTSGLRRGEWVAGRLARRKLNGEWRYAAREDVWPKGPAGQLTRENEQKLRDGGFPLFGGDE